MVDGVSGGGGPVAEGLSGAQVRALAELFADEPSARVVLEQAGFSPGRFPWSARNAVLFWGSVSGELRAGAVVGGTARLVAVVREWYPGNAAFAAGMVGSGGQERVRGAEHPSAPAPQKSPAYAKETAGRDDQGVDGRAAGDGARTWDFFVSYTGADRRWAEWVAWQLEDAGYRVLIQAWDFVPGSDWMFGMDQGIRHARRMIVLLSAAYLTSVYGGREWLAVRAGDPEGFTRKLLPVRIEECDRPGLLRTVVGFDLFGLEPEATRTHLLEQVEHSLSGRAKPATAPEFPVPVRPAPPVSEPEFPPAQDPGSSRLAFGAPLATLTGHTGPVGWGAFSPDGALLATGSNGPDETAWLPEDESSGTVRLWDVPSGRERATLTDPIGGPVWWGAFSPDGALLATGSNGTVRLWDVPSGRGRAALTGPKGWLRWGAFSPGGALLASGGYDGTARLWDVPSGRERATLTDDLARLALWKPGRPVWWGTFSPDGALLATSFGGGTARLWDVPSGQRRATLNDVPQTSWLGWGTFSPDGALLAIGVGDGTARLWDVRSGRERATLTGPTSGGEWGVFSPDGALLATTTSVDGVRLWDVRSGRERATLARHGVLKGGVAFSPDGALLATGSIVGTVQLWDVRTGRERATLTGHTRAVSWVAFSPDGALLATTSEDGTARLWVIT